MLLKRGAPLLNGLYLISAVVCASIAQSPAANSFTAKHQSDDFNVTVTSTPESPVKPTPERVDSHPQEETQEFHGAKIIQARKYIPKEEALREEKEQQLFEAACFHVSPEFCQHDNFTAIFKEHAADLVPCNCKPHPSQRDAVICCNVTSIEAASQCFHRNWPKLLGNRNSTRAKDGHNNSRLMQIHIQNATLPSLDMANNWWQHFDRISVTDGLIKNLLHTSEMHAGLTCLNVSNNHVLDMPSDGPKEKRKLKFFDISYNNLTHAPDVNHFTNLKASMRGNMRLQCRSAEDAIEAGFSFLDRDNTFCLANHTFHWFNSTDLLPLSQLYQNKALEKECPPRCRCYVDRYNYADLAQGKESTLASYATVDCTNSGLSELPQKLPANTASLKVEYNNISSLSALNRNPTYQNLTRLYADNNLIANLFDLEGTTFIENFEVISLRRNRMKTIPFYLLTKTLDKSPRGKMLYFGGNKLICDCNSAKVLRLWLLGHQNHVKDLDEIYCDNIPQLVMDLSEATLCQSQHDWADYVIYFIAIEVILLLAIIIKVSYDYCIFKKLGYLPWPANKMPKLPCDWLCET